MELREAWSSRTPGRQCSLRPVAPTCQSPRGSVANPAVTRQGQNATSVLEVRTTLTPTNNDGRWRRSGRPRLVLVERIDGDVRDPVDHRVAKAPIVDKRRRSFFGVISESGQPSKYGRTWSWRMPQ